MVSFKALMKLLNTLRDFIATLEARASNPTVYLLKGPLQDVIQAAQECRDHGCLDKGIQPEIKELESQ